MTPEAAAAGRGERGTWWGVLFFTWMYGTPLGLVTLVSHHAAPVAGWLLGGWLAVTLAAPAVGLVATHLTGADRWRRRFAGAMVLSLVVALAGASAWQAVRTDEEPPVTGPRSPAPYERCVAISGGTNTCPGG
jgi:hypothetical protein